MCQGKQRQQQEHQQGKKRMGQRADCLPPAIHGGMLAFLDAIFFCFMGLVHAVGAAQRLPPVRYDGGPETAVLNYTTRPWCLALQSVGCFCLAWMCWRA